MAKQIEGVYERVLDCAKEEFLKRGYTDASLRTIAVNAKTTTGSIYTRFGDKEGLFSALVEPAMQGMLQIFRLTQETFHALDEETQKSTMPEYSSKSMEQLLDYMYTHFDAFRLLIDSSYGTKYHHFIDEMVRIEVEYTYQYMEVIGCESIKSGIVTEEFLHIITTAYFEGVFEVVRHNMQYEEAKKYIHMLRDYHMAGFETIFSPPGI
ncbi:TetR/AcrR family transcriptional regulator [Faecalispora sporosphaeroides]|uniref:TetR/AcrR family transcriptional regulator n=1 Tax=Faecalispora sporosphaeroides TaxID=1549 RepID=A0A928KVK4_9FIRM|nr:TetR/AcrR family transcriptional regulator [Faecalispora sporosphaeroides]MBE6832212.1 TetR/AcrR family transcriptional regulator [Faecalispora sporosphaeroides]